MDNVRVNKLKQISLPPQHEFTRLAQWIVNELSHAAGITGIKWRAYVIDHPACTAWIESHEPVIAVTTVCTCSVGQVKIR